MDRGSSSSALVGRIVGAGGEVYGQWSSSPGHDIPKNIVFRDSFLQEMGAWKKRDPNPCLYMPHLVPRQHCRLNICSYFC